MIMSSRQLKDRIRNLSKQKSADAQTLMRIYMIERFLERLSFSEYNDRFILKGGTLVAALVGVEARSTMDLDASVKGADIDVEEVEKIISSIIEIPIDDGVTFSIKQISEIMDEAEYPGVRVSMDTMFDGVRTPIKIDISTGDVITPHEVRETPENPAEAMSYVTLSIVQALGQIRWQHPEYHCTDIFDFEAMSCDLRLFKEKRYTDADPVMWSDEKKLFFLQKLCEYDVTEEELKENDLSAIRHFKRLDEVAEEEAGPIREIIEEMEKKGYRQATEAIAFCCYSDSWIYRYDIRRVHDLLLKLLTDDNNPDPYRKCIYATLLGNIYYRGLLDISLERNEQQERQNRKKAFYFYSLGAVGDLAEAKECLKRMKEEKSLAHEAEDKVFRETIMDFANKKYQEDLTEEIKKKIEWELDAVARKDHQAFYVSLAYALKNARESHPFPIYTQGGAPFITYLLGINDVDPVRYNISSKMEMGLEGEFSPFIGVYLPEFEDIDLDISDEILFGSDDPPQLEIFSYNFTTLFMIDLIRTLKPETFDDYLKIYALSEGINVWENNQKPLTMDGTITPDMLITTRDDLYEAALGWGLDEETAYRFTDAIRKGKGLREKDAELLKKVNAPEWVIEVCAKIKYLPPRRSVVSSVNRAWAMK